MIPNAQHFQAFSAQQLTVRVGFGRAEITPPLGTLCALGADDNLVEIFDPIYVRATVLGEGANAVAILSLDVIGLYRQDMLELRNLLAAQTGLDPDRIILHATHSHESPNSERCFHEIVQPLGLDWQTPEFYDLLRSQMVRAVQFAQADARPSGASFAFWPVAGLASNRRLRPLDGPTVLRQSRSTPEYRQYPEGWIDPYVRMLVLSDAADGREHWLMNYACHPTAAGGDEAPYITGDFPGNAMARIVASRPRVTCSYLTGCCGNINPGKYTETSNDPAYRAADVVRLGGLLAEATVTARKHGMQPVAGNGLRYARHAVNLPLLPRVLQRDELEARLREEVAAYLVRRQAGQRERGGGTALFWTLYNLFTARCATPDGMLETEVSAIGLGDVGLLFLPGECFLEIAAGVRAHFPERKLLIAALCDYGPGYVVTPEAFEGGGYESEAALCDPAALQKLIDAGITALETVLPG
jgi:neutral ceramidase